MSNPTGKGGFRKGESGNKLGRPKSISSLALEVRQHAQLAISVLTKACKTQACRGTFASPQLACCLTGALVDRVNRSNFPRMARWFK
jgi:hypothetical protein